MSSSFTEIMTALNNEVHRITDENEKNDRYDELSEILIESIDKTLQEIESGADVEDFKKRTIVNLALAAARADFSDESIKLFITEVK